MAPCDDLSDRGPWPAARRRVRLAAARVVNTVRTALMQVTRRLAETGMGGAVTPSRTRIGSIRVLQDEYRAGFPLPPPHPASAASDLHECPWCLSLGNPHTPGPADPAEH